LNVLKFVECDEFVKCEECVELFCVHLNVFCFVFRGYLIF